MVFQEDAVCSYLIVLRIFPKPILQAHESKDVTTYSCKTCFILLFLVFIIFEPNKPTVWCEINHSRCQTEYVIVLMPGQDIKHTLSSKPQRSCLQLSQPVTSLNVEIFVFGILSSGCISIGSLYSALSTIGPCQKEYTIYREQGGI